jgi:hypothetical protein
MVKTPRKISTEHQPQTDVGLSNGQVTSATHRHLAAISAPGPFKPLQKARETQER